VLTRDELRAANQQIEAAAEKAGRDPGSIRRIINVQGVIGDAPGPSRSELPVGYLAGEPRPTDPSDQRSRRTMNDWPAQ
jgi:alkanesulfonate monooxygenase SsuD/methylene tetrahydromethanopterin reductase-like flavin-dependent oxidoreductase (luciferase family)